MEELIDKWICLSSTANKDLFPTNTNTSFINQLPDTLWNRDSRPLYMKILMVGMPVMEMYGGFSNLKINVYEVESQKQGLEYTHNAGIFPYPPSERISPKYATHTFPHAPTLLLRYQRIDKLHIRLTDEFDEEVTVQEDKATLIWARITSMPEGDQFTVTCLSHQPATHPDNSLVLFRTPLTAPLTLTNHEVALLQVVYPPGMEEDSLISLQVGGYKWTFNLDEMDDYGDLISRVNHSLNNSPYREVIKIGYSNAGSGDSRYKMYFARSPSKGAQKPGILVSPSPGFLKACGLKAPFTLLSFTLHPSSIQMLGRPKVRLGMAHPMAMLECDIIEPNIMCGQRANLLHVIPILRGKQRREKRIYEPPVLAFHPVKKIPISRIQFRFVNPDGTMRKFKPEDPEDCIIITLLFRIKQQQPKTEIKLKI